MTTEFHGPQRVIYIPTHANGDRNHPDCERGLVSSISECGKHVRVKFDKQVGKFGWEGATAQSCDPSDLVAE